MLNPFWLACDHGVSARHVIFQSGIFREHDSMPAVIEMRIRESAGIPAEFDSASG
jgi:hypothetical protein